MKLVFPGGEHPQVLLGRGVNRIGSGPEATIQLQRPGVMERHCELHVTASGVMLQVPEGAAVQVNGRAVDGVIALRPGDSMAFDRVQARLASLDAPRPAAHAAEAGDTPVNDDPGATALRPSVPRYVLRGISSAGFGRTFPLLGPTTLGRAPDCGIHLDHPGLSRHHVRLTPTDSGLLIEDLESTNGCLLNDARVARAWARHGDELGVDVLRFRVVQPGTGGPVEIAARGREARRPRLSAWWWVALAALVPVAVLALALLPR